MEKQQIEAVRNERFNEAVALVKAAVPQSRIELDLRTFFTKITAPVLRTAPVFQVKMAVAQASSYASRPDTLQVAVATDIPNFADFRQLGVDHKDFILAGLDIPCISYFDPMSIQVPISMENNLNAILDISAPEGMTQFNSDLRVMFLRVPNLPGQGVDEHSIQGIYTGTLALPYGLSMMRNLIIQTWTVHTGKEDIFWQRCTYCNKLASELLHYEKWSVNFTSSCLSCSSNAERLSAARPSFSRKRSAF